jgi:hypothetical protein
MGHRIQFQNRFTDLSPEINHLDSHIFFLQKLVFTLQIEDQFFLNLDSGRAGCRRLCTWIPNQFRRFDDLTPSYKKLCPSLWGMEGLFMIDYPTENNMLIILVLYKVLQIRIKHIGKYQKSIFRLLKGQCQEIFAFRFFSPLSIPLGSFQIFSKICRGIHSSRCTTGVVYTCGKWKKSSIRKVYLCVVELTYR